MTLHVIPDYVLISIDLKNAHNAIWRAIVIEQNRGHKTLRRAVPYWRATLGPQSLIWAEDETLWGDDRTMDCNKSPPP